MIYKAVYKKFFQVKKRKKAFNWKDVLPANHPYPIEGDFENGFPDIRDYDLSDPLWYHKYADAIKKYEMEKHKFKFDDDDFLNSDMPF